MVWCLFAVVFVVDTNHAVVLRSSILSLSSSCNSVVQVDAGTFDVVVTADVVVYLMFACVVVTGETNTTKIN